MKDFYDLWVVSGQFEFEGAILARAVRAKFKRRGTDLPKAPPVALTSGFAGDSSKQAQWAAFVKRGKLAVAVPPFEEVVAYLATFLWPPTEALGKGGAFAMRWPGSGMDQPAGIPKSQGDLMNDLEAIALAVRECRRPAPSTKLWWGWSQQRK